MYAHNTAINPLIFKKWISLGSFSENIPLTIPIVALALQNEKTKGAIKPLSIRYYELQSIAL
ncbi:hypothetical protein BM525_20555 (plasmid) [Alteromonas mediterranea]|nr:hypothetical protein BM525_20555 [Alteromonas mediterranea]